MDHPACSPFRLTALLLSSCPALAAAHAPPLGDAHRPAPATVTGTRTERALAALPAHAPPLHHHQPPIAPLADPANSPSTVHP